MPKLGEFERYIKELCEALGHRDRHGGFADYSRGLMLPIERKSVEPLAAHTDPLHVSAKHQSCITWWRSRSGRTKRFLSVCAIGSCPSLERRAVFIGSWTIADFRKKESIRWE